MRIGSLFTGSGMLDIAAAEHFGGEVVWHAERDKHASALLDARFPGVPNLGDVSTVDWSEMKKASNRKLTDDQVVSAVEMYRAGLSLAPIAEYFGVSRQAMWDLLRRRTPMRKQQRYGADNHFYRGGASADERAHDIVEKAVASGRLARPDVCETCDGTGGAFRDGRHPIQAHHCDYNKPLDVMWLCQPCHHEWHRTNTAIPVSGGDANGSLADIDVLTGGFP